MGMLIPAGRLRRLPKHVCLVHEYCFFLHDEFTRMLVEYEAAKATVVPFRFTDEAQRKRFEELAGEHDVLSAMRELGMHSEARRVVMNNITMAMVSDCAHHLYEALRCFEKRKAVPGFNLLRKPLLDSLMYFSWMVADEDAFYSAFTSGDPTRITQKMIGNRRRDILARAIDMTALGGVVTAEGLMAIVFDAGNPNGLYELLQHAVHLVTVERVEIRTSPENFNFIFKNPDDDDIYEVLYAVLPTVLLYLAHVIMVLYERIKPMGPGGRKAFIFRSTTLYRCLGSQNVVVTMARTLNDNLSPLLKCRDCDASLRVTPYNALRLLLTDSFRCVRCRRKQLFPLSWIF